MKRSRVAVIGGGLGGLSAAGALAKAGCEVSLFEATAELGGKAGGICVDGVTLDTGPTLLTMSGLVRSTFETLGAGDLTPRFVELTHQCAYEFADSSRFDVHRDLERTAESASHLGAVESKGVFSFYAEAKGIHAAAGEPYLEAPFEGFPSFMSRVARRGPAAVFKGMAMGTLADLGARHFRTEHLRQFVGRFATYAGASPFQASAAFALIPWLEHAEGVHHVVGGMAALSRALGEAVKRAGARVHLGARASWRPEGARWRVIAGEVEEEFDAVVVNADPLASLSRRQEPLAMSGFVLLLDVAERLDAPHHTVLFSRDYRREFDELFGGAPPSDPTIYVCHPAASDPGVAPEGRSGLFVMVNAPALGEASPRGDWEAHAATLRERCLERLDRWRPGLRSIARVIGERTPVDLERLGAPGGSIYGFLPHGKLGPFRRPRIRGPAPGLFFAGGGTHPGGGVPLVMLSGRFAAELALEHLAGGAR